MKQPSIRVENDRAPQVGKVNAQAKLGKTIVTISGKPCTADYQLTARYADVLVAM